jgi:hypothetical protein
MTAIQTAGQLAAIAFRIIAGAVHLTARLIQAIADAR